MRSPSGSKEICNGSARERHRSRMRIGCGTNRIEGSNRTGVLHEDCRYGKILSGNIQRL